MALFNDNTSKRAVKEQQLDVDFDSAMYKAFKKDKFY